MVINALATCRRSKSYYCSSTYFASECDGEHARYAGFSKNLTVKEFYLCFAGNCMRYKKELLFDKAKHYIRET